MHLPDFIRIACGDSCQMSSSCAILFERGRWLITSTITGITWSEVRFQALSSLWSITKLTEQRWECLNKKTGVLSDAFITSINACSDSTLCQCIYTDFTCSVVLISEWAGQRSLLHEDASIRFVSSTAASNNFFIDL